MGLERYDAATEKAMRDYYGSLSEKDRRRYAAVEARKLPHGGIAYVAELFGCCPRTVSRGLAELELLAQGDPAAGRERRQGAGRPKRPSSSPS